MHCVNFYTLNMSNIIATSKFTHWQKAKKTAAIFAKPMRSVFSDISAADRFLIDTIEGKEKVIIDAMLCRGSKGEYWQQTSINLFEHYSVTGIVSGWLVCDPKSDYFVDVLQFYCHSKDGKYVQGLYGEDIPSVGENLQLCLDGDYICRSRSNPADQWVVGKSYFENTYSIICE
jgi:hypothetical protein